MDDTAKQAVLDEEHLRLLRMGYFISAGFAAFFAPFGLFYAGMGLLIGSTARHSAKGGHGPPPEHLAWFFAFVGLGMALLAVSVALLRLRAAKCLRTRSSRTFCLVMGAISCFEMPYGTALGIFTFMVLSRPSVRRMFETAPGEALAARPRV